MHDCKWSEYYEDKDQNEVSVKMPVFLSDFTNCNSCYCKSNI